MDEPRDSKLALVDGDRDAWLRHVGIHGTNEELAAALRVMKRRAALSSVPARRDGASEGS